MSAQTATRYTCADCRKTYRSFRTEEEWRASHIADVCTAQGVARPAPSLSPRGRHAAPPHRRQPSAHAPSGGGRDRGGRSVRSRPPPPSAVAALLLLYVAFDGFRIMSDATDAGPRAAAAADRRRHRPSPPLRVYQLGPLGRARRSRPDR